VKHSFAHIINLIAPGDNAELYRAQKITVASVLAATKYQSDIKVELLSAQFANAMAEVPSGFRATAVLEHCAADKTELRTKKRFPLLREILSRLNESENATHFVYTNLDIAVMPYFYRAVSGYLDEGYDALIINRRRISGSLTQSADLEKMYAEAGETHTGYDCFVFSRELLQKFVLKDIYIGTPPSGNDLFHNLMVYAANPVLLTEKHLTFHLGMDLVKPWGDAVLNAHNEREYAKLLKELRPLMDISKFPGAGYGFFKRHFKWLMNPTFHYPTMLALDFSQLGRRRRKPAKNELDGIKNRYYEWMIRKINFRDKD
jgi:hypothetical protein